MTEPILTITLNPALDIAARTRRLVPRAKLRCDDVRYDAGGGGLNVARVLHRLGLKVHALYGAGGASGDHVAQLLAADGVPAERVSTAGVTRSNFAVGEIASGEEYRFVLPGPELSDADWRRIRERAADLCPVSGHIVASGSLPIGAPVDAYAQLAEIARARQCRFVLDTAGPALLSALDAGVHTIKPSRGEFLAATATDDLPAAIAVARRWIAGQRVERVAVSLGHEGARVLTADGDWSFKAPPQKMSTTVGAGDAFVAGLVAADSQNLAPPRALLYAAAVAACAVADRGFAAVTPEMVAARVVEFTRRRN